MDHAVPSLRFPCRGVVFLGYPPAGVIPGQGAIRFRCRPISISCPDADPGKPGSGAMSGQATSSGVSKALAGRTLLPPLRQRPARSGPASQESQHGGWDVSPSSRHEKPANAALQQQNRRGEGGRGRYPPGPTGGKPRQAARCGMQPEGWNARQFSGHSAPRKRLVAAYTTLSGGEVPCILCQV